MDNDTRTHALAEARTEALRLARNATDLQVKGWDLEIVNQYAGLATMWAVVAEAMKVGSDVADRA